MSKRNKKILHMMNLTSQIWDTNHRAFREVKVLGLDGVYVMISNDYNEKQ